LQDSIRGLIGRHESLRTSFVLVEGEPYQQISADVLFSLEDYESEESGLGDVIGKFARPFDLSEGPLMRVGLIRLSSEEHVLLIDMHHIITDGVSQGILIRDFMSIYGGEAQASLRLQYKDYSEWLRSSGEQSRMEAQRSYWLGAYSELPDELSLPQDYARPRHRTHAGGSVGFRLDAGRTSALRQIGESQGATLFMVLLSAYNVLLSGLSGQEDIVVGSPVAGRRHADLEGVLGMFVNMLCLRNYPRGDQGFSTFVGEVRERTLSSFDHQDFQYEELVEAL